MNSDKLKSISEINEKIEKGDVQVFTASEIKKMSKVSVEDVDVVTTGTCGIMSGTSAIFHFKISEPGAFRKVKEIYLNGVPGFPGPCPNENLGSVDLIVYGTSKSIYDHNYGGGFLFKDIIEGKNIQIEAKTVEGRKIETEINIEDMETSKMLGTRMAFQNYSAFLNSKKGIKKTIFSVTGLRGPFKELSFSGCGELNPLQNDPEMYVINVGSKALLNGSEAIILGLGTRSSKKPNLMIMAEMKDMESYYIGGFKTGSGPEIFNTIAIPIPILNKKILNNVLIKNSKIPLPILDVNDRREIGKITYADVWNGVDKRPKYKKDKCLKCKECKIEKICPTDAFKPKEGIDFKKCFGCSVCAHHCKAIEMKTGVVEFNSAKIPVTCRQSDIKRAEKLSLELKKRIENGEFYL
ncbi:methanogenesis marker 16 metalloprotein [Methanothermus fervidus DSM 2088]|uniref:Methanogenesis marker 16 metalloprotein n=1 Tax=Methanothermus fervidus (strain ATCC 43054 / DSM 2088 / JCM 10308 / V24 S) TaxID=523846 RepID=E3GXB9_METFV|nr:methanogenesis marker 16 metalloprotein [Methanothermus fervidus]ADP76951.1 methanogenesis marker 16 metalloprotein [Methanothermus fervidus DSM 2088]